MTQESCAEKKQSDNKHLEIQNLKTEAELLKKFVKLFTQNFPYY